VAANTKGLDYVLIEVLLLRNHAWTKGLPVTVRMLVEKYPKHARDCAEYVIRTIIHSRKTTLQWLIVQPAVTIN
jgi:hypothetical protein